MAFKVLAILSVITVRSIGWYLSVITVILQYRVVSSAYMAFFKRNMSGRSLMNKRKRVGPRIEPYGTPALIANSGDNLPSKKRKEEII